MFRLQAVFNANIFAFALNLEYMEADFYLWASKVSPSTLDSGMPQALPMLDGLSMPLIGFSNLLPLLLAACTVTEGPASRECKAEGQKAAQTKEEL